MHRRVEFLCWNGVLEMMEDNLENHISPSHIGWISVSLDYLNGWIFGSLLGACLMSEHSRTYEREMGFNLGDDLNHLSCLIHFYIL